MGTQKIGVVLMNLGTPVGSDPRSVRSYLAQFLMDPYVIDIPWLMRWILVHLLILPRRPKVSSHAYSLVWTERGSPLRFHTADLTEKVRAALGNDYAVEMGMRYGQPSIESALEKLAAANCRSLIAIPLFPQYSLAATESAVSEFRRVAGKALPDRPSVIVRDFFDDSRFLAAFEATCREELENKKPDFVLFSFHGLPERHVKKTDATRSHCLSSETCCAEMTEKNRNCYRAQSYATARALAQRLGLAPDKFGVSFQSRLGRTPWIKPYTDHLYDELPRRGIRRLLVVSPSFVADCLETLEEIEIRGREQFLKAGGTELWLTPSLNSRDDWARAVADFVRQPPAVYKK